MNTFIKNKSDLFRHVPNRSLISVMTLIAGLFLVGCQPKSGNTNSQDQQAGTMKRTITAPVAKKVPYAMTQHNHTRVDNYYWMRDDSRQDPEILAHLELENAYLKQRMAHTEDLQTRLFDEMVGRIKKNDDSVPYLEQGYWWFHRYEGESEYPIYLRRADKPDAKDEVLLNVNKLAEGLDYFNVSSLTVSTNNQIMAYSSDNNGRRIYDVQFRDLTTGKMLADKLTQTDGSLVWANDNQHIFYIKRHPQTLLAYQVYRHKLGTSQDQDVLMYQEDDETFYTDIIKSRDDSLILIYHSETDTMGVSILDANNPKGEFQLMMPLEAGHEYALENLGDWYYIYTNDDAKNFKIMKAKASEAHDKSKWQTVLPHREDVFIEDFVVLNEYIVVEEKQRGMTKMRVIDHATGTNRLIPFQDPAYYASFSTNRQMTANNIRIYYSSMTTPGSVLEYDLTTLVSTTLKQDEILGDFDSDRYASERIFVAARDGKEMPVSIVYRKDKFNQDGSNPLYQYAYGSYGSTVDPYFSASRLSLLDRGFVYAIAHVRGGQMLGRPWYDDGKMFNKKNTFTDFIDVTRALTAQGYSDKNKVFAVGGSAGGLLVGAVANMAPELYLGIGAHVPFVDVVTTMSDPTIPLTTGEYGEWGNPADKASYDYMLSYSPYDQVSKQDYPNILVTTGLHDSQVQYFEPMKWVAKLREFKTDDKTLLFLTNMDAGHGGASGRFRSYREKALEYAFFMDLAGVE